MKRILLIIGCSMAILMNPMIQTKIFAQEADPFALPAEGASGTAAPTPPAGNTPPTGTPPAGTPPAAPGPVVAAVPAGATAPTGGYGETEQIETILQASKFKLEKEAKDPFRPLIEKKIKPPPAPPPMPKGPSGPPKPPPPPAVKPLQLFIQGVCGNDSDRLAMVVFENKPLTIQKGQQVEGKFKVVDILNDKVIVYSEKEQMRKTFPIGGGK
ncbi:MAG: hypothetical protein HQM08_19305 [Candidatus Riflebacteria bacterium]|nr:hypothetical protein [Candidatus Riflebacteria bacterium]